MTALYPELAGEWTAHRPVHGSLSPGWRSGEPQRPLARAYRLIVPWAAAPATCLMRCWRCEKLGLRPPMRRRSLISGLYAAARLANDLSVLAS